MQILRVDFSFGAAAGPANRLWPNSGAPPGIPWSGLARARERRRLFDNSLSVGDRVRHRASNRGPCPVLPAESPRTSKPLIRDLGIPIADATNAMQCRRHG